VKETVPETPSPRFIRVLRTYSDRLGAFHPNARLYLLSAVLTGASLGVFRLLFNFFILSKQYDATILGTLVTTSSLTALIAALPMGFVADRLGRKRSLIMGGLVVSASVLFMALFPSIPLLFALNVTLGIGQSLSGVTMGPFLMENSNDKERVYLFSFSSGLQTASAFIGNWIGGYLPTWSGQWMHASSTSTQSYGLSIIIIATAATAGIVPLLFLGKPRTSLQQRTRYNPLMVFHKQPALIGKLILPMLITSVGAGLIMPFMNVYFRQVYHQPDPVIGAMFAWGSLAMGIGLLIAPALADKYGKIQVVVITQALSVPFLIMLGFSPVFFISAAAYYVRLALMNMSSPVYQTFVMEHVDPNSRATIASLVSMANSFGWAFSPIISGWLQDNYGFKPAFLGTILLYCISIFFYWRFFWHKPQKSIPFRPTE
jgi:MFS family permease